MLLDRERTAWIRGWRLAPGSASTRKPSWVRKSPTQALGASRGEHGNDARSARTLKAEASHILIINASGFGHHSADQVVGDEMQEHFAVEQGRAQTTEPVHLQGGFDVPEEQLDRPAPQVELGQFGGGVGDRIEQRGDQNDVLGTKAGDTDRIANQAQGDLGGQGAPKSAGGGLRLLLRKKESAC